MLLMIDNYDSFTYNLVQYLGELGADVEVYRNDEITVEEIKAKKPEKIMISPGPCTPDEAGISMQAINAFAGEIPILGVCLGHQSIGQVFGGKIIHAKEIMHGKTSPVAHCGVGIFQDLPSPFPAMRYHSLVVDPPSLPPELTVTAWTDDRPPGAEIMALQHIREPVFGVQFHPESIGTAMGQHLIKNFLDRI